MNTQSQAASLLESLRVQAANHRFTEPDDIEYFAERTTARTEKGCATTLRILMERAVIRKAVTDIFATQHEGEPLYLRYHDGDHEGEPLTDVLSVMQQIHACDEEYLRVCYDDQSGRRMFGTVYLVFGNDGWDVICDYTLSLEELLAGANALAGELGDLL